MKDPIPSTGSHLPVSRLTVGDRLLLQGHREHYFLERKRRTSSSSNPWIFRKFSGRSLLLLGLVRVKSKGKVAKLTVSMDPRETVYRFDSAGEVPDLELFDCDHCRGLALECSVRRPGCELHRRRANRLYHHDFLSRSSKTSDLPTSLLDIGG